MDTKGEEMTCFAAQYAHVACATPGSFKALQLATAQHYSYRPLLLEGPAPFKQTDCCGRDTESVLCITSLESSR